MPCFKERIGALGISGNKHTQKYGGHGRSSQLMNTVKTLCCGYSCLITAFFTNYMIFQGTFKLAIN